MNPQQKILRIIFTVVTKNDVDNIAIVSNKKYHQHKGTFRKRTRSNDSHVCIIEILERPIPFKCRIVLYLASC